VPDGSPITPRAPAIQRALRLRCGGQDGREGSFIRITEVSAPPPTLPPISDPGRNLLAARRTAMEARWQQARA
jgi:hypothetical protein